MSCIGRIHSSIKLNTVFRCKKMKPEVLSRNHIAQKSIEVGHIFRQVCRYIGDRTDFAVEVKSQGFIKKLRPNCDLRGSDS